MCGPGPVRPACSTPSSLSVENDGREGDNAAGEVLDLCKGDGKTPLTVNREGVDGNRENAGLRVG